MSSESERARRLYDEGAAIFAARWDDDAGLVRHEAVDALHDARRSLAYAEVLLRDGTPEATARAARIIGVVATMQELREDDAREGNFRWFFEDAGVTDLNAVEFVLDHVNALLRDGAALLPRDAIDTLRRMLALGLEEVDRLDVHSSYTNIYLSDVCNSVLGGEALGDETWVERGRQRLDAWFAFTNRSGAPHEFNSPTYAAVDILRMAALASRTADPAIALRARVAEERLWLHAATHYHPPLAKLAGPHARSYRDGWTGAPGFLTLMLWRLLGDDALRRPAPFFPQGREEGHTAVALAEPHVPRYVRALLETKRYPYETIETADAAAGLDITTYMTESFALGTASRSYAVGEPPEPWPAWNALLLHLRRDGAPGWGTLSCRYVIDDKERGAAEDFWEEGQHVAAQHRNRAIVAYGLTPRLRSMQSCKLSVRLLGVSDRTEVWCGDLKADAFPMRVEPGEPVVIDDGDAYVALVPLEPSDMGSGAPVELDVRDGALVLDIYNYRGPAKQFWEHRSQSGPFYKGNVRNAFIIEVAERAEFADVAAFRRHVAAARITDSVDDEYVREIAYASDGGSLALRYSLWDMRLVERRCDGEPFTAPMGRAGAVDGGGAQWLHSRASMIELEDARLLAGRAPKWLSADPEAGRYVFVNPSDEEEPVWLETPRTIVECDAFGFGRIEVDEAAGAVEVEAEGLIGVLRLRSEGVLRLMFNGVDVTERLTPPDEAGVREMR